MRKIAPEMTAAVMLPETSEDYSNVWLFNAFIKGFLSVHVFEFYRGQHDVFDDV